MSRWRYYLWVGEKVEFHYLTIFIYCPRLFIRFSLSPFLWFPCQASCDKWEKVCVIIRWNPWRLFCKNKQRKFKWLHFLGDFLSNANIISISNYLLTLSLILNGLAVTNWIFGMETFRNSIKSFLLSPQETPIRTLPLSHSL